MTAEKKAHMSAGKLIALGLGKILAGAVLLGVLLFLPAGTWAYPGAWRMIVILCAPMLVLGAVLLWKAPRLLEKRLGMKETEAEQVQVIAGSAVLFVVSFVLCGLDYRLGWTHVPEGLVYAGCAVFLICYIGFAELLRENEFLSRTVEVQENQQVISTGLYGIIRHPMYVIVLFMFVSMPVLIGSFAGCLPMIALPYILVKRIRNEEQVLEEGLPGYREYEQKVRYRLIPFIW